MSHINIICRWLTHIILEISSLSDDDFIRIVAHYNTLINGEKGQLSSEIKNRGYTETALKEVEKKLAKEFKPVKSCGLRFTKPFGHIKYPFMSYILTLFENYQRGNLPFEGSVADQPAQIMEIFSVLSELRREQEEKLNERLNRNGRNQRQNHIRASR